MKVSIAETSSTVRTIRFEMPRAVVTETYRKRLEKVRKQVHLNGFRPGMVPAKIVETRFGDAIRAEATEEAINTAVREELQKAAIEPVAPGKLDNLNDDGQGDLSFDLVVEVDPPVDIQDYANTGVTLPEVEVLSAEVDTELENLRRAFATEEPTGRPAEKGDVVFGLYERIEIGGEERPLPENPVFRSVLGESATQGFDDGLVGINPGESREVSFQYPDNHHDEEFRGKQARFTVKVEAVSQVRLPEIDDEFAKRLSSDSIAVLRERVLDSVKRRKVQAVKREAQERALDAIIAKNPFEVPQARVTHWVAHSVHEQTHGHHEHHEGEELPTPTAEDMEKFGPAAIRELKKLRIIEQIVSKEKFKVSQSEVDERVRDLALRNGLEFEDLKTRLRQSGRIVALREDIKAEKALDLLVGIQSEVTA